MRKVINLRVRSDLHEAVRAYASSYEMSQNSAIVELLEVALGIRIPRQPVDIHSLTRVVNESELLDLDDEIPSEAF